MIVAHIKYRYLYPKLNSEKIAATSASLDFPQINRKCLLGQKSGPILMYWREKFEEISGFVTNFGGLYLRAPEELEAVVTCVVKH